MRIIGGKFKNRRLFSKKGFSSLRPTSEKLREALFNICQDQIEGADFLDLFAGSGAVGLEALSRGAHFATFIEKHPSHFSMLKKNLNHLQLSKQAFPFHGNVLSLVPMLAKKKRQFDLIYLDPPYANKEFSLKSPIIKALKMIEKGSLLKKEGSLFVEEMHLLPSHFLTQLYLMKKRHFGKTLLFQFQTRDVG